MIIYDNLWKTMKEKGITQYMLINKYHISAGQLSRIRTNNNLSTHTIDTLCTILDCNVEDIMTFVKNKNSSTD